MRYLANLHWWYKGEFEASLADREGLEKARQEGLPLPRKHTATFMFEWDGPKGAIAEAARIAGIDLDRLDAGYSSMEVFPVPYPTIRDLLKAPVVHQDFSAYRMEPFLPPDLQGWYSHDSDKVEASKRIRLDFYVNHSFDGDRGMNLVGVFFDDEPVMIFQTAGRDGRDHSASWQISRERYQEMCQFMRSLPNEEDQVKDIDLDEEIPDLCVFYGRAIANLPKDGWGYGEEI